MFRSQKFSILYFLLVFFSLSFFLYCYVGVISPGGKGYSPFLDKYANFPAWFTYLICKCSVDLLKLLGYDAYQKALNNVSIRDSRGINIIWACLGFKVMSFWVAFIVAHRADWIYKLKWSVIGVSLITGINIIRMDLIALGLHYSWKTFNSFDIHSSFTIASYLAIFGLMCWFIRNYRSQKKEIIQKSILDFRPSSATGISK